MPDGSGSRCTSPTTRRATPVCSARPTRSRLPVTTSCSSARLAAGIELPTEERRPSGVRLVRVPLTTAGDRALAARPAADSAIRGGHAVSWPARAAGPAEGPVRVAPCRRPGRWRRWWCCPGSRTGCVGYVLLGDQPAGLRRRGQLDYVMTWRRSVLPVGQRGRRGRPGRRRPSWPRRRRAGRRGRRCGPDGRAGRLRQPRALPESGSHARQGRLRALVAAVVRAPAGAACRRAGDGQPVARGDPPAEPGHSRARSSCTTRRRAGPRPSRPRICIRERLGLSAEARIALYHGGFSAVPRPGAARRGVLEPGHGRVHPCSSATARYATSSTSCAADPRFGGRMHCLDAVPPDELAAWVASADVGVMPNQPSTPTSGCRPRTSCSSRSPSGCRSSSSRLPERRRIILDDPDGPLGAVCEPTDVSEVARAIRSIVDCRPASADALRSRDPARGARSLELGDREWRPRRAVRGAREGVPVVSVPGEPVSLEWAWRDRGPGRRGAVTA